jgi:hypothetical protein
MDARRLVIGTLVGGIVVYALGYLIFILAFGSFYAANVGSATGVIRDPEIVWAVFAGSCAYAALEGWRRSPGTPRARNCLGVKADLT